MEAKWIGEFKRIKGRFQIEKNSSLYNFTGRKYWKFHKNLLELINEFRKVAGYKINTETQLCYYTLTKNNLTKK